MADDSAVTLAVVAILASCVGGLLWIIKFMFGQLIPMIEKLNQSTLANTEATKNADKYLRDRNGRDGENHEQLIKATEAIATKMQSIADSQSKALLKTMNQVKEQKVEHQHVDQVTINGSNNDEST